MCSSDMNSMFCGFLSSLSQSSEATVVPTLSRLLVKLVGYRDDFRLVTFASSLIP